jgi:hypothetical protein
MVALLSGCQAVAYAPEQRAEVARTLTMSCVQAFDAPGGLPDARSQCGCLMPALADRIRDDKIAQISRDRGAKDFALNLGTVADPEGMLGMRGRALLSVIAVATGPGWFDSSTYAFREASLQCPAGPRLIEWPASTRPRL